MIRKFIPLIRNMVRGRAITVGNVSVSFEHYDKRDDEAMLVVADYSKAGFRRLSAVILPRGDRVEIAPGFEVELHDRATVNYINLAIFAEGLPVTPGWLYQRKPRLVA